MAEKGKQERKGGSERRGLGAVVCGGLRLFAVVGIGPSHKPQRALEKRRRCDLTRWQTRTPALRAGRRVLEFDPV